MSSIGVDDQYFTYEGRLASFQRTSKKRGSAANGRGAKALNWPHKQIAPSSLAQAGFFFNPAPENPDNVTCFLCHKGLDGWEAGDDPLLEHLTHSASCGWAIVSAIEAGVQDYDKQDPTQPAMVEARKSTFAGKWPHEAKRGWKCKTKQLVAAGWKYTPSLESDDMATCAYCQLALDGWEQNDKPFDEHYNRAPECPFFTMSSESQSSKKKTGRSKASQASKTSRLSVQSIATTASDIVSVTDHTMGPEDSILTTASTKTRGEKKSRAKKSTTAKSKTKKSKAKKDEPTEIEETVVTVEETVSPPPKKATRGTKRGSDAVEDSTTMTAEAPAPKRRNTKTREDSIMEDNTAITEDTEMTDVPAATKKAKGRKKARASNTTNSSRKMSSKSDISTTSLASSRAPMAEFPDDDEIERQLQADLEEWSEDEIAADPETERTRRISKEARQSRRSADYAMFNPAPVEANDAEVENELKTIEAELHVNEEGDQPQELEVPKNSRKTGTRKASKQTKANKTKATSPDPLEEPAPTLMAGPKPEFEVVEEQDGSMGSTNTVLINDGNSHLRNTHRGPGRPPKASSASRNSQDEIDLVESIEADVSVQQPVKRGRGRPSKASLASQNSKIVAEPRAAEAPIKRGRGRPPKNSQDTSGPKKTGTLPLKADRESLQDELGEEIPYSRQMEKLPEPVRPSPELPGSSVEQSPGRSPTPVPTPRPAEQILSTPGNAISPAPSAKQAAISPSQSPQASDAENQPPSSNANASTTTKRIALAPIDQTPMPASPSKRNMIAGLQSTIPWTAVDIDAVLGTPRGGVDKENAVERFLQQGSELTSPEKRMTVEEWIYFNAGQAEKKLKHECETMVSRFESEGTKAMNVLEGLAVD